MEHEKMEMVGGKVDGGVVNNKVEYLKFGGVIFGILVVAFGIALLFGEKSFLIDFMRDVMGVFFIVFALFQFAGYKSFVGMFADYDPIAKMFKAYAYAYPFIGLVLGCLYIFDMFALWRDIFTLIIMFAGAYGVWKTIHTNKTQVHCACLGNLIKIPLSTVTLVEDVVMGAMALWMLIGYLI